MHFHLKRPLVIMRFIWTVKQHKDIVIPCIVLLLLLTLTLKLTLWREHPSNFKYSAMHNKHNVKRRIIYVVTPTYPRSNQLPEITKLAQTLMLVPDIHWIVADDTKEENTLILEYLLSTGLPHTYLKTPMPSQLKRWRVPPVGVSARRAALFWIRTNAQKGVVFFADDDNTYDYRLFEEIRSTKGVSMFPVGFVTKLQLSTPILRNGQFVGWYDGWIADRKFPIDMAAFAFSVELLKRKPRANMAWTYSYQEESILASLGVKPEDIEFKADACTKIWAWHTKSVEPAHASRDILLPLYDGTNLRSLQEQMYIESLVNEEESKQQIKFSTPNYHIGDFNNYDIDDGFSKENDSEIDPGEFTPEYEN